MVLLFIQNLFGVLSGYVEWKEYYIHFLLAKGYPVERAKKHVEDYDEIDLDYEGESC